MLGPGRGFDSHPAQKARECSWFLVLDSMCLTTGSLERAPGLLDIVLHGVAFRKPRETELVAFSAMPKKRLGKSRRTHNGGLPISAFPETRQKSWRGGTAGTPPPKKQPQALQANEFMQSPEAAKTDTRELIAKLTKLKEAR